MGISWNTTPTFCGMFFPKKQFTEDGLMPLSWAIVEDNPYTNKVPPDFPGIRYRAGRIAGQGSTVMLPLDWDYPRKGRWRDAHATNVYIKTFHTGNSPTFAWPGHQFLSLLTFDTEDQPTKGDRPVFLAKLYRKAIESMQPDFAWLDDFGKQVFRDDRREVDLRQFAWGATCYGPELVEQIGEDKLASCPTHAVERLDWGGYWVQLAENPFKVDYRVKQKVQDHLGLTEHFQDSEGPRQLMPEGDIRITS